MIKILHIYCKQNRQTIVDKTEHRKLNSEQHEPHYKIRLISCAQERLADSHMAPVLFECCYLNMAIPQLGF